MPDEMADPMPDEALVDQPKIVGRVAGVGAGSIRIAQGRSATPVGPCGFQWHLVRVVHGYSLGRPSPGAGLWQRHDLLAASAGMAASWRLGALTQGAVGKAAPVRSDRLESRKYRWSKCFQPPGGEETGPNPTDRGKLGSKRHLIVDRRGLPLALDVTGANRHDSMVLERLVDALPSIKGLPGRARRRPDKLHADKGYDFARCRRHLRWRGIQARIARRGIHSAERLGPHRWVVERTHAWLAGFGKLRIRFERRLATHLALLRLACSIICIRFIDRFC